MKTLADVPVSEWPPEIGRVTRGGVVLPVCTCGRVRAPGSITILTRSGIPGRARRARMTRERREHAERVPRSREPEMRPQAACNACIGPMLAAAGMTRAELDRRLREAE